MEQRSVPLFLVDLALDGGGVLRPCVSKVSKRLASFERTACLPVEKDFDANAAGVVTMYVRLASGVVVMSLCAMENVRPCMSEKRLSVGSSEGPEMWT